MIIIFDPMRNLISLFTIGTFLLLLFSCTKTETVVEESFESGEKKIVTTYVIDGETRTKIKTEQYYQDGQLEMVGSLNEKGEREGKWDYYYPSGKMWSTCEYKDGKKHGKSAVFFETGKPRYEGTYSEDSTIGKWKFYNKAGKVVKEVDY